MDLNIIIIMEHPKRIFGLITDFGNKDYFIGTLKGIIKKINPNAEIIDISKQLTQRIKLMLKGSIRTPQFMINGEKLPQITSMNQLTEYMR